MMRRTQQLIERYLDLMTESPKIQFGNQMFQGAIIFQFILRLHFILPKDGWNVWTYSDYKLDVPYVLLSYLYQEISDALKIILIVLNVVLFLLSFFKVKLIFYYNNLLWTIFYIPQVAMVANFGGRTEIQLIGVLFLFSYQIFNLYYNRATKFIHSNPFVRKFTQLTIISVIFDTVCFIDFEFHLVQQIFLNFSGIVLCLDILIFKPYRSKLNKFVFQFNFLYLTIVIINTCLLLLKKEESMFYFSILIGTMAFALSRPFYERNMEKESQDQYIQMILCQEFYESKDISQYIKMRKHQNSCRQIHQDNNPNEMIICSLEQNIQMSKRLKLDYEILELALVHFLCIYKAPLTALCRLIYYYNIPQDHSFFFKVTFPSMHKQLWKSVTQVQEAINRKMRAGQYQEDRVLTTRDIYEAVKIRDTLMPMIVTTLDYKLNYWRQLVSLITNFKKLFYVTLRMSAKVRECKVKIEEMFHCTNIEEIQTPKTVLEIIVLIIYYAVIINDHENSIKWQKILNDTLRSESLIEGKLLNGNIMENKICLLYTSIVKNQGSIIKINAQQIARFWGYENEMDFRDVKHINQLMPEFLANVHDQYLERFKKIGHSILFGKSRTVFLKGKNNFYILADITIDNFFISYDDYIITAAFSKAKEKCLFMLFDSKGKILGVNSLMFKLLFSIDKSITQDLLTQGYVFQLIPKIFYLINTYNSVQDEPNQEEKIIMKIGNPIRQQFQKLMHSSKEKTKHQMYYAGLWTTFDTPEQGLINRKLISQMNINLADQKKPECELFDESYQRKMKSHIDESIVTTNFQVKCEIEYIILGYYKSMPIFTLQIHDIIALQKENSDTEQSSLEVQDHSEVNKSSHLVLSEIQDESFQKVKLDETDKLQQYPEISLIRGKYDMSFYDQLQESSRQILGPFSQRANFNLIKHKSINDDSKYLEDEFRILRLQQEISYDQQNHFQQQISKNKTVLDILQEQKSSSKQNENTKNQNNDLNAVNSGGSIAKRTRNHQYELIKSKSRSTIRPFQLQLIMLLDLLIVLSIFVFNVVIIAYIDLNRINGNDQLHEIKAPYLYNGYYCELTSHDLIQKLDSLNAVVYSDSLLTQINDRFKSVQYIANMSKFEKEFVELEKSGNQLTQNISIHYLDQPEAVNQSFIFYYNQMLNYFRILIINDQNQKIEKFTDDYQFQQSLFEILNLEDSTKLYLQITRSMIDKFYASLNSNEDFIINLFIIETIVQIAFFFIQFFIFLDLLSIYRKIIHLNCRLYEKDVYIAIQRFQTAREILLDKYSIGFKKADYVYLMYQPINQTQQINASSSKQNKTTLLSSRIQSQTFNVCKISVFLLSLLLIVLVVNIGGFVFNSQMQKQLKPSYQLTAEFLYFSIQVDSVISNAIRVKSQNILIANNSLTSQLSQDTLNEAIVYFQQERYQNLTNFASLITTFQKNQIKIIKNLINDPTINPNKAGILNQLLFQDICPMICPEFTDERDNCTLLYNKGIVGIYTKVLNFISSSYSYERTYFKLDPDNEATLGVLNSADFIQIFGHHFTNAKAAFEEFADEIMSGTLTQLEQNFEAVLLYYLITGFFILMVVGIAFAYIIHLQQIQINQIRLSLTIIPVDLIDQQAISILRQL